MIQQGSAYWLKNQDSQNSHFNLLELASTQRAITNYVKILTGREIPVEFVDPRGDSMTDGESIEIASRISHKNVDEVVGLALHEASHCILTDFKIVKKLGNVILQDHKYKHLFPNRDHVFLFTNFMEDRRIDDFVYNSAPGYKAYYESMYESSFFNDTINKGLTGTEYRTETWESYMFRIINIFNPNSDLDALYNLRKIYDIIDLDHINRLKSTRDSIDVAMEITDIVRASIIVERMINEDNFDQSVLEKSHKKEGEKNDVSKEKIKNAFQKQENFIKGKVKKSNGLTSKQLKQVDAVSKANVEIFKSKFDDKDINVHIIKKLTDEVIKSGLYGAFQSPSSLLGGEYGKCFEEGVNKGKRLLKKLQIRNESTSLESHRLKKGKIDTRRVYASDFTEDIFKRIDRSNYKPLSVHLSIDGSGSMHGEKWRSTLINAIALGYVSLNVDNIDLVITIRTSGDLEGKHKHVPLLIFCFDSKVNKVHDLRRITNYRLTGSTPEGLCLDALNKFIPTSSYYLDSYLINMSDGMPNYRSINGSEYVREEAYAHTAGVVNKIKKKNVKLLSYFISKNKNKYKTDTSECFKQMYGRDSRFVDVNNINQVTQTLNKLFLSENMIS
jgi:hypothetical protein